MKDVDSLKEICSHIDPKLDKISIERYSYGKEIRIQAKYPKIFPLRINSHHGVYLWNKPHPHEYNSDLPGMLIFNRRLFNCWNSDTNKPAFLLPNPFILYRKRCNIKVDPFNQCGSIFFLSHSTIDVETEYDSINIINDLKNLPLDFYPVKVAFHFIDVLKNRHDIFLKNGFKCVSAGHMYNSDFVEKFYQELVTVKYSLSNTIGSHAFYSIDLGIPFSLIGEEPRYILPKDLFVQNNKLGRNLSIMDKFKKSIGVGLNVYISDEVSSFVKDELGEDIHVSKFNLFIFLLSNTLRYYINKVFSILNGYK